MKTATAYCCLGCFCFYVNHVNVFADIAKSLHCHFFINLSKYKIIKFAYATIMTMGKILDFYPSAQKKGFFAYGSK